MEPEGDVDEPEKVDWVAIADEARGEVPSYEGGLMVGGQRIVSPFCSSSVAPRCYVEESGNVKNPSEFPCSRERRAGQGI